MNRIGFILFLLLFSQLEPYAQCSYDDNPPPFQLGTSCSAYGTDALLPNFTSNIAVECSATGFEAMYRAGNAKYCTAIGARALHDAGWSGNFVEYCVAVGCDALRDNSIGNYNTAVGFNSMISNNGPDKNTAIGYASLGSNQQGFQNTAVGNQAMAFASGSDLTDNTALGADALQSCSERRNSAAGIQALLSNSTGQENTAIGYRALMTNSNGSGNTAIGQEALEQNQDSYNTAVGGSALKNNDWGFYNVGIGTSALVNNTSGSYNIALGQSALAGNTTQNENTAIGANALYSNQGNRNVSIGYASSYNASDPNNSDNTAIGVFALGSSSDPGDKLTIVGHYADVNSISPLQEAGALGNGAIVGVSFRYKIGNGTITNFRGTPSVWTTYSDARFKENRNYSGVKGIEFIMKLKPATYNFDTKLYTEHTIQGLHDSIKKIHLAQDFAPSSSIKRTGFIAQEVDQAAKESNYEFSGIVQPGSNKTDYYSLCYATFVVPIIKSLQEQDDMLDKYDQMISGKAETLAIDESHQNSTHEIKTEQSPHDLERESLRINPNPFTDECVLTVNLPRQYNSKKLLISNLSGRVLKEILISDSGTTTYVVRSAELGRGLFICSLVLEGEVQLSQRLVVNE